MFGRHCNGVKKKKKKKEKEYWVVKVTVMLQVEK